MLPDGKGRFCNHCQHTIVDFSRMSDAQVVQILSQKDAPKCGRWRNSQLNRVLEAPNLHRNRFLPRFAVGAMLALAAAPHAILAQSPPTQVVRTLENQKQLPSNPEPTPPATDDLAIFSGKVIWKDTGEEVPFATVRVKDRQVGTVSDEEGNFKLEIPRDKVGERVEIVVYLQYDEPLFEATYEFNSISKYRIIEVEEAKMELSVGIIIEMPSKKDLRIHKRENRRANKSSR